MSAENKSDRFTTSQNLNETVTIRDDCAIQ